MPTPLHQHPPAARPCQPIEHRARLETRPGTWQARARDPRFPTVQRNLGLAYFNKRNDATRALAAYEAAVTLDPTDARVLFEYDQLRKRLNHA
ncbi:MAG TPA: tetratricopeptide repeat protein, partial [Thauera aminoaromatica]|nr:tetratricopeptide repeat protein [Thauera aminoaromatica]